MYLTKENNGYVLLLILGLSLIYHPCHPQASASVLTPSRALHAQVLAGPADEGKYVAVGRYSGVPSVICVPPLLSLRSFVRGKITEKIRFRIL